VLKHNRITTAGEEAFGATTLRQEFHTFYDYAIVICHPLFAACSVK